jgi:hypothetical protein
MLTGKIPMIQFQTVNFNQRWSSINALVLECPHAAFKSMHV